VAEPPLPTPPPGTGAAASRTVLGRGLLYTVGTAAPVLANAVVTPFVTRLLGSEEYGIVATALVVIQVGMILAGLGLGAAITRHGILERSGAAGARFLVRRGAVTAVGVTAVGALLAAPLARVAGIDDEVAVVLALVSAAGFSMVVNAQAYLRVADRPLPFVLLSMGAALGGPVLGMVLLLVVPDAGDRAYLAGLAAGFVVTGLAGLALTARHPHHERGDTRRALRVGLPTIPHQVAIYLASGVLVLVAGHLFGAADAGRLQLAVLIGSAPGVLTSSLNNAWAPVVYRADQGHRGAVLERTGRDIMALTALTAGGVALLAPLLLRIVAPPSYDPAALTPGVGLAAIGSVLSVLYLANVHLVFASGRSEGLAVVTPTALLVGTLFAWGAGTALGLTAVASGMAVTYAAMTFGVALLARRVSPVRWSERMLAAPLAVGVALCLVGAFLPVGGGWSIARAGTAAALVVLAGAAMRRILTR
jgi:O-antigen/teichoic acid export membrane protein